MSEEREALIKIAELHSPILPPEGYESRCTGCQSGSPYYDNPWPCETAEIVGIALPDYEWEEQRAEP